MNKVVAFDLDGTLINEDNQIIGGQKTIDQLKTLINKGFQLNINTGRLDHDIMYIIDKYKLPIKERISQNGAVTYSEDSLQASLLNKTEALNFYQQIKDYSIRVEMNTVSNRYWHSERDPDFPKEYYDSSHIVDDFTKIIMNQPVVLFLLIGDETEILEARTLVEENFPKLEAIQTSETSLEILSPNINKGQALHNMYGKSQIFAIGDAENDYSMFDIAEYSYLVSQDHHPKALQVKSIDEALDDILNKVNEDR